MVIVDSCVININMKLLELYRLDELGSSPARFHTEHTDNELMHIRSDELNLDVYYTRGLNDKTHKMDVVFIEFAVHGSHAQTGTGNEIKIFSTVKAIIFSTLQKFVVPNDTVVSFGADNSEPSRVSLYHRFVPIISKLLGPEWSYVFDNSGSLSTYTWHRKSKGVIRN